MVDVKMPAQVTEEKKISEIRGCVEDMFAEMDFVDDYFHPGAVDAVHRLARMLGIPVDKIPTERRYVERMDAST